MIVYSVHYPQIEPWLSLLGSSNARYEREDVNIDSQVELEEYVSPRRHLQARVPGPCCPHWLSVKTKYGTSKLSKADSPKHPALRKVIIRALCPRPIRMVPYRILPVIAFQRGTLSTFDLFFTSRNWFRLLCSNLKLHTSAYHFS